MNKLVLLTFSQEYLSTSSNEYNGTLRLKYEQASSSNATAAEI